MSEVARRLAEAYESMNNADLDALMTLYASDACIRNATAPATTGLDEIRTMWQNVFATFSLDLRPAIANSYETGDVVIIEGSVSGQMTAHADGGIVRSQQLVPTDLPARRRRHLPLLARNEWPEPLTPARVSIGGG